MTNWDDSVLMAAVISSLTEEAAKSLLDSKLQIVQETKKMKNRYGLRKGETHRSSNLLPLVFYLLPRKKKL